MEETQIFSACTTSNIHGHLNNSWCTSTVSKIKLPCPSKPALAQSLPLLLLLLLLAAAAQWIHKKLPAHNDWTLTCPDHVVKFVDVNSNTVCFIITKQVATTNAAAAVVAVMIVLSLLELELLLLLLLL